MTNSNCSIFLPPSSRTTFRQQTTTTTRAELSAREKFSFRYEIQIEFLHAKTRNELYMSLTDYESSFSLAISAATSVVWIVTPEKIASRA